MPVTKTAALGWENCARLSNAHAELIVTLDVGPRVLSYKTASGENVLRTFPDQLGKGGEPKFMIRGGHRLWVAPEGDRTYAPDNAPLAFELKEPSVVKAVAPAAEPWGLRREMTISLAAESSAVMIEHGVTNESAKPVVAASWALTVLVPGGVAIIPQPPLGIHGKDLLPNRVIVPWTYTDLSDDRWKIGRRFFLLEPKKDRPSTKLGHSHRERWVGYLMPGALFVKTFDYEEGALYPDLGCNYETFSKDEFIELETLSPLKELPPGGTVAHTETWHLFDGIRRPESLDDEALEKWLAPFLSRVGIL